MNIIMRTVSAGPDGNRFPGKPYQVSDAEGCDLVLGGYAFEVKTISPEQKKEEAAKKIETADAPQGETAEAPEGRNAARRKR